MKHLKKIGLLILLGASVAVSAECLPPNTGNPYQIAALTQCEIEDTFFDTHACQSCPAFRELSNERKRLNQPGGGSCYGGMHEYYCKKGVWAEESLEERAAQLMSWAKSDNQFPSTLYPCIAARETTYLEPATIDCTSGSTSIGIGQINRATFAELFKVYRKDGPVTLPLDEFAWLVPYNCKPGKFQVATPDELFEKYFARDPRLQVLAMQQVLKKKSSLSSIRDLKNPRTKLQMTLQKYNAGPEKVAYSDKVLECVDCMARPLMSLRTCLSKSSRSPLPEGKICRD